MNHDTPKIIPEILRNELKYAGKWISRAAMHGDAEAMALTKLTSFSLYYEAANVLESFYWVKRAAELKSAEAYYVNGQMWGNSIAVVIGLDGIVKKIFFQVIMNEGIAEVNLQQFRRLCAKVFGTPRIATEEFHAWEDEETSVVSARNGKDAVFEWGLV